MIRPWYSIRIEPTRPTGDPDRGFRAELADPAWVVGRQWQLGELRGENASSPIQVRLRARHLAIRASKHNRYASPKKVPAEVIVESGPDDWWTSSRRIRLGRAAERAGVIDQLAGTLSARTMATMRCTNLPAPYDGLNGTVWDGHAVWKRARHDPVFAEVPRAGSDAWHSDELAYRASFPVGPTTFEVGGQLGHDGGAVDWWSVDAGGPVGTGRRPREPIYRWPQRFEWPGGPARRWWQIEDHHVDLGGRPPDRAHLATTMLLDLVMGHADDWFLVPVPAHAGNVLTVTDVEIVDAFGDIWKVPDADPMAPPEWSLFGVERVGGRSLPMWLTAPSPLQGEPIEEVAIGVDEDANLVWAVEERLGGRTTDRTPRASPALSPVVDENAPLPPPPDHRYTPVTAVPPHWTPYTVEDALHTAGEIRFRQGRLVSINKNGTPVRAPIPRAELLQETRGAVHEIVPWRLPPTGMRLERRAMLTRDVDGRPRLWIQRRRVPLLGPSTNGLAFDRSDPT